MAGDFSKLRVKINKIPDNKDIIKEQPLLQQYPEFNDYCGADRNNLVRYIILAYDPGSPFVEEFTSDLKRRKEAAADEAGFQRIKSTGKWPEEVQEILNLDREDVVDMVFCYLRIVNNQTWSLIVTNEQVFSEYTRLLLSPVAYSSYTKKEDDGDGVGEKVVKDDKKLLEAANMKSKLREECKLISADLKGFYKELFGDNEDLKEKVKAKPIRPETIM